MLISAEAQSPSSGANTSNIRVISYFPVSYIIPFAGSWLFLKSLVSYLFWSKHRRACHTQTLFLIFSSALDNNLCAALRIPDSQTRQDMPNTKTNPQANCYSPTWVAKVPKCITLPSCATTETPGDTMFLLCYVFF